MTSSRPALVFAVIGAESTGKSTLAADLAQSVRELTGLSCTWVPEFLREWCEVQARTPNVDEQAEIAAEQALRIDTACRTHDIVIADTTPLMTAVYHRQVFGDRSLDAAALKWHRRCTLTLLTALDLPWQEDGLQRDGPHVREPVDNHARSLLIGADLPFTVVSGQGAARLQSALNAITPHLRWRAPAGSGLFTRLAERDSGTGRWRWSCSDCDRPECEQTCLAQRPSGLTAAAS